MRLAAISSTLLNQRSGSSPGLRLPAQARDLARPRVVGREGEQLAVDGGDRGVLVEVVDHPAVVLDPGVDVALELVDVGDVHGLVACRGRHHLHHSDRAHAAALLLVEPRLLVPLGDHQQRVELVRWPYFLKMSTIETKRLRSSSLLAFFTHFVLLRYFVDQPVARERALLVGPHEGVHRLRELRAVLAEGPGDLAGRARDAFVLLQVRKHLQVEVGHEAVHDRRGDEPGVHHLEDVAVLEHLVGGVDLDRGLAFLGEAGVQRLEVLRIAARGADVELLARELVDAADLGSGRAGDQHLANVLRERLREVHPLQALGRDGEGGRGDVALAGHEPRQQLVARDRDHDRRGRATILLPSFLLRSCSNCFTAS